LRDDLVFSSKIDGLVERSPSAAVIPTLGRMWLSIILFRLTLHRDD
jgi:hypothetical protein